MKTLIVALLLGLSLAGEPTAASASPRARPDLAAIIPTLDRATACRLIYAKEAKFEAWFRWCDKPGEAQDEMAWAQAKMACTLGAYRSSMLAAVEVLDATPVFEARFGSMVAACPAEQEQALASEDKTAKRRAAAVMRKLKQCLDGCKDEACCSGCLARPPHCLTRGCQLDRESAAAVCYDLARADRLRRVP